VDLRLAGRAVKGGIALESLPEQIRETLVHLDQIEAILRPEQPQNPSRDRTSSRTDFQDAGRPPRRGDVAGHRPR
jgi:hypothetical protein